MDEAAIERDLLRSAATRPGKGYIALCVFLALVLLWALVAWGHQVMTGLGVTGLNSPVFWGLYLVNFVFFIGVSHSGTLISSILRITNTEWRRPFTRLAEAVTVFSLPFGATSVIVDLGRPDRLFNVLNFPHFSSAILWDVLCITTYLITSCLYFFMALVPDIAVCRDRLTDAAPWRRTMYRLLALGWTGTPAQHRVLNRILTGMSIFLFALVISVHTNVSFVFGMTTKPGWASTIISPFFVLGAIYSGVAAVVTLAIAFRRVFHLEEYLTPKVFNSCSKFLLALCCFWFYGMVIEHLFGFYHGEEAEMRLLYDKCCGRYAWTFWTMVVLCLPVPFVVLAFPRFRTMRNLFILGIVINIGMWLERYSIIIPSGANPYLAWGQGAYTPSWVEVSITAGWVAGFLLLILVFARLFPLLTIWEVKEGLEQQGRLTAPGEATPPVATPPAEPEARPSSAPQEV